MKESKNEENVSIDSTAASVSDDQGKLGEIQIAIPVVENMVRMITTEVEGVIDVIGSGSGSISGIFSSKSENRSGVRVSEDETGAYTIEVRVALAFGVELGSVAYTIQNKVIEEISRMTSKGVTKVDVFIDRVEKPGIKKATPEPEPVEEKPKKKTAAAKTADKSEKEAE